MAEEAESLISMLNPEQRQFFDMVKESVENGNGGIFALDAPGGTGKTFCLSALLTFLRGKEQIAIATATTAIAAIWPMLSSNKSARTRAGGHY